ncbi:hypothetical protein ACFDR9_002361 [Janthinobacterium sp. CG_23.3]|uniref:DUF3562 domain-containing protein n=1 Tax=unclassified Janthinobacterium TaxID=2610881 RepID=UPI000374025D|nr:MULTISPECIES: DUF3562 domain-containing protein [unclassified Janthinobacterium]MEC5161337.1 hypothetical protein [Janthinobacterium sp. CG_S6]
MIPIVSQESNAREASPRSNARSESASTTRHMESIHALCNEIDRPFEELAALYQWELARLTAIASVWDYLPVLVVKHVREIYRHR